MSPEYPLLHRRLSSSAPALPYLYKQKGWDAGDFYQGYPASFQQKQLQDKEQKLLSLFESHQDKFIQKLEDQTHSRTSSAENQNVQMSSGKVRQLFEERRKLTTKTTTTKTSQNGWDKSHPLKPIKSTKTNTTDPLNKLLTSHNKEPIKNNLSSPNNENTNQNTGNGIFGKLPNIGGELLSTQKPKETNVKLFTKNTGSVKPTVTTTGVNKAMANVRITPAKKPVPPVKTPIESPTTPQAPPRKRQPAPAAPVRKTPVKIAPTAGAALATVKSPKSPVRMAPPTDPNMAQCKQCGRNFAKDRIEAHQKICSKTAKKKRKVFDPVKHRLKGTEAESYLTKIKHAPATPQKSAKSSNWRKKHEDFIANIRAAKQAQDFVKKGGNIRDLPPPPPMDTSDLVPCPHCGRKFSEGAAERHIPKCATMRHNKPAPGKKATPARR